MHPRRARLTEWIALQTSAAAAASPEQVSEIKAFPLREPGSGRMIRRPPRSTLFPTRRFRSRWSPYHFANADGDCLSRFTAPFIFCIALVVSLALTALTV